MAENRGKIKPGEVRNPRGRPKKGETLIEILRSKLDEKIPKSQSAYKDMVVMRLIQLANSGDLGALKYIFDRMEGSPRQAVEHTGADGGPIEVDMNPAERKKRIAEIQAEITRIRS
jgi:hypothetical protein